jgi:PEP-CTERM motif
MLTAAIVTIWMMVFAAPSWALPIETGAKVLMAADGDGNSTVSTFVVGVTSPYTLGYYLDGDYSHFNSLLVGFDTFSLNDGQIIDLALVNGTSIFTASGNASSDPSAYSVIMDWAGSNSPSFSAVNVTWSFSDQSEYVANIGALAAHDGFIPVPEASTLLLLGSGLAALGLWNRKKRVLIR